MSPRTDPSPVASSSRRRTAVWTVAALLVAGAAALIVASTRTGDHDAGSSSDDSAGSTSLAAGGTATAAAADAKVTDPFAPATGPIEAAIAKRGLSSRLEALRIQAAEEIARRGVAADPETLALLEQFAAGPDGRLRAWAQAALMRIEGSRRFLAELAEHAGAAPFPDFNGEIVRLVDPAAGEALIRGFKAEKERSSAPAGRPIPGLSEALAALVSDPKRGGDAVAAALRASEPADEPVWLEVAAGVKPVPSDVAALMAERIGSSAPDAQEVAYGFVLRNDLDLSSVPDALPTALASHLARKEDPLRGASMRAIGRLRRADSTTIGQIVRAARDGEQASYDALIALRNLGPSARPYVPSLIALEPVLTDSGRFLLAQALLAIGGDEVGTFAASRLAVGGATERAAYVEGAAGLASATDAGVAIDALARLARSDDGGQPDGGAVGFGGAVQKTPLLAVASADPTASHAQTVSVIAAALGDAKPARRADAVRAVGILTVLPAEVASALARLADDPDDAVRTTAVDALAGAWKFGADAKPLVPAVLGLIRTEGPKAPPGVTRVGLLRTIGAADPDAPAVRARLRVALASPAPDERLAGLYGLSRVAAPTAEEKSAVAAATADPLERVSVFAAKILATPGWKREQ